MMADTPRVRAAAIAEMTSLSVQKVQEMAAQGRMPGAAKLGGVWTFDPEKVQACLFKAEQAAAARAIQTQPAPALPRDRRSLRPDCAVREEYDRLIKGGVRNRHR